MTQHLRRAPGAGSRRPTLAIVLVAALGAALRGEPAAARAKPSPTPAAGSAAPAARQGSGAVTAETVTRKVQDRYDATRSFTAAFKQEMRLESGGQVLRSAGKVTFQRPGKMRWSYEQPEPQAIVADGDFLWIYQPADHQVLKAPLREAFESRTPVSFLLGVARIERDFDSELLKAADDGSVRLRLKPREDKNGNLGTLTLELDPVTYDIRAAIIQDSLGNTTRVTLEDLRRNQPVDADAFKFEVPYGADVITPGG